jgi:DHA2 family multidrug resistance protein-like MFS transporter
VNVPVMVLLLVVGPRLLPEYRAPDAGRLDLASAALSVVAVLGVIYGIKRAAQDGIDGLALTAMAAGVLVGIVFVRRQARLSDPLIDLRMFRAPRFSVGLGIATLAAFVMYGLYLLATEYMQLVLGLSPLEAGLWLLPSAVAVAAGSNLAPQLVRWFSPAAVIAGGLAMMVAGFAALTTVEPGSPLALLIAASVVIHLGVGPVSTLLIGMIVGAAPPERAGAASALSHTGNEFGGALGLGLLGSLVTAIYRHDTGTTGAFADVDGLPAGALQTAERAIAHGFEVAAFVSAGLVAGALVLALAVLRTPARRDAESPATAPA